MLRANNNIPKDWEQTGKYGKPQGVGWTGESVASLRMEEPVQESVERDNFNRIYELGAVQLPPWQCSSFGAHLPPRGCHPGPAELMEQ